MILVDLQKDTEKQEKKEKKEVTRTRKEDAHYNRECNARAAICIAAEKAWKPSRSRLSGLSDLHARQVHTAESVYYVFNSRVLHTRHSDSTDFHNTTTTRERG